MSLNIDSDSSSDAEITFEKHKEENELNEEHSAQSTTEERKKCRAN